MNELMAPVFAKWDEKYSALWANQPLCLEHRLHENPRFSRASLGKLIEKYPSEMYTLVHMGAQGEPKLWRQDIIGDATGDHVIESIAAGRL